MVAVDINLYDTEGIPLLREGTLIPWSEVGMSYEDIDKLGVWLLVNRRANTVTIAMRLDEMFSGGRENRRILTLRIAYESEDELDRIVEKFPGIIGRFLRTVEEKGIASYRGPIRTEPKWDYLSKYVSKTARILRSFRERPRIRLPYINYSKPSISERGEMFKFFMHLSRSLGASRFLGIFSKSGSVTPDAVWICGDGRPVDELEARIGAARLKRKTKSTGKAEKDNAVLVYSVGAFLLGALLVLGLVYAGLLGSSPPKNEGAVVVPATDAEFQSVMKAINQLPGDDGKLMMEYLAFANSTDEVSMKELLRLVQTDIKLHMRYRSEISSLNRTNMELEKQLNEAKKQLKNLTLLQKSISGFSSESRYFALVAGNEEITLKPKDTGRLKKEDGINGWLGIMRGQCRLITSRRVGEYIGELEKLNRTLANYSSALDMIAGYLERMNATKSEVFMQSKDKIDKRMSNISELQKELGDSVKGIKTCRDAYTWEMNWSRRVKEAENITDLYSDALKLASEVKEKGINSTLIQGPVLDYATANKHISKEDLQKKIDELFVQAQKPLELFMKLEELLRWIEEGGG